MNIWSFFDLLAPRCPVCRLHAAAPGPLCPGCHADLPRIARPCPRCALPLAGEACGQCRPEPAAIDRTVVVAAYAFPVDRLVQQLKFSGRLPLGRVLGTLLADRVRQDGSALPQLLLPVPLHPARERQRGFNQARVVADTTGRALQLPVDAATLQRRRNTPAQSGLDLAARQRNLQAAFRVCGPLPSHVALVDDVITTGSTVLAIAGILRQHGVRRVDAWAVARTL